MKSTLCEYYEQCGNCSNLLLNEQEQKEAHLESLSKYFPKVDIEYISSPSKLNYRSRITLKANEHGQLGYFKAKTHDHVAIKSCSIAHEAINDVLSKLPPIPFPIKGIELRSDGENVIANILSRKGQRPTKQMLQLWAEGTLDGIGLDGQRMWGQGYSTFKVCGVEHQISMASFVQVNQEVNELLVQRIQEIALSHNPTKILDLYSGIGNISFALAHKSIPVVAIESASSSVRDAQKTAKKFNYPVEIRKGDASRFEAGDSFFDVAVLDPPRKGAKGIFVELCLTRPKCIIYVSCNRYALIKDLNEAKKQGYFPQQIIAFDMFPQTDHIELLVELTSVKP